MRRYIGLVILSLAPLVATLGNGVAAQQKPGAQRPGLLYFEQWIRQWSRPRWTGGRR